VNKSVFSGILMWNLSSGNSSLLLLLLIL
jgi:hypothetical protein